MHSVGIFCLLALPLAAQVGVFTASQWIAQPSRASANWDRGTGTYRLEGSGALGNAADAFLFHYVKVSGAAQLTADLRFPNPAAVPGQKIALLLRASLSPDSPYVAAILQHDGLTYLQVRAQAGAPPRTIPTEANMPPRLRLLRQGTQVALHLSNPMGGAFQPVAVTDFPLPGPYYLGIALLASTEQPGAALLSNLSLEHPPAPPLRSHLEVFDLKTRKVTRIHTEDGLLEAPNWSRDGKYLLVNARGRLFRLSPSGGPLEALPLPDTYRANNDHDLSPDGKFIAFSASTPDHPRSRVYVADADGRNIRLLTEDSPSYFHGWSPDGKYLAFVGQRTFQGIRAYELYRIPFAGGREERLTTAQAYDDGPEYSPDGRWIYFNSNRAQGGWDLWRIPASGAGDRDQRAERITQDAGEDWFPHFSPNGQHLLFLTFPPGTIGHNGRMPGMQLRRLVEGKPELLHTFTGGQGSLNVNSWSPDSRRFAYVAYDLP